ncbi:hypothetical protein [Streptomyces goshikiensis]|uniref:hypothetical protein n=1 Tax=Streptomyces goshikiensis TaxID=1942 RepID=UPI0036C7DE8F
MFIRPVGVTVSAAIRPSGRPLLRGLLARATTGTPPGHGVGVASRSTEQPPGAYAYADPYADADAAAAAAAEEPPYPEQAGAYPDEPPYPEPDDADEPDWSEPAAPGTEPGGARAAGPGGEPGGGHRAGERAAEPYAGLPAELAQLAGLAREGLLTPEEFAAAKALLLQP